MDLSWSLSRLSIPAILPTLSCWITLSRQKVGGGGGPGAEERPLPAIVPYLLIPGFHLPHYLCPGHSSATTPGCQVWQQCLAVSSWDSLCHLASRWSLVATTKKSQEAFWSNSEISGFKLPLRGALALPPFPVLTPTGAGAHFKSSISACQGLSKQLTHAKLTFAQVFCNWKIGEKHSSHFYEACVRIIRKKFCCQNNGCVSVCHWKIHISGRNTKMFFCLLFSWTPVIWPVQSSLPFCRR